MIQNKQLKFDSEEGLSLWHWSSGDQIKFQIKVCSFENLSFSVVLNPHISLHQWESPYYCVQIHFLVKHFSILFIFLKVPLASTQQHFIEAFISLSLLSDVTVSEPGHMENIRFAFKRLSIISFKNVMMMMMDTNTVCAKTAIPAKQTMLTSSETCSIYKNIVKLKKSRNKVNPVKWWNKIVQFIKPG